MVPLRIKREYTQKLVFLTCVIGEYRKEYEIIFILKQLQRDL